MSFGASVAFRPVIAIDQEFRNILTLRRVASLLIAAGTAARRGVGSPGSVTALALRLSRRLFAQCMTGY
jgi:hypothetical protein